MAEGGGLSSTNEFLFLSWFCVYSGQKNGGGGGEGGEQR